MLPDRAGVPKPNLTSVTKSEHSSGGTGRAPSLRVKLDKHQKENPLSRNALLRDLYDFLTADKSFSDQLPNFP
jgi:hypothetical protein